MNLEKVFFAFFIVLALTLNFGFFLGELDNPDHHNVYELFAALVVSLIATIMKFGDRAHIGAVLLTTSAHSLLSDALPEISIQIVVGADLIRDYLPQSPSRLRSAPTTPGDTCRSGSNLRLIGP